MAIVIGSVPPGLILQDLVGGPMTRKPTSLLPPLQDQDAKTHAPTDRDKLMRIYLPEGTVRVMTLTEYQDFLASYRCENIRPPVEAPHSDDGGSE